MFSAYIPDGKREPLRIAITNSWQPTRIPTPRFMDAWSSYEDEVVTSVPVLLDDNCENVVVWRTQGMSSRVRQELHVAEGEISFSRVYAKSGSGRDNAIVENDGEIYIYEDRLIVVHALLFFLSMLL